MDRDVVVEALRHYFASRDGVAAAWLFGSVARDRHGPRSDIDVGVLFTEAPPSTLGSPVFVVEGDLEALLGARVQVVAMNGAPCDLVHRVLRDGVLVAENNRSARIGFEVRARNEYFDLEPMRRRYRGAAR